MTSETHRIRRERETDEQPIRDVTRRAFAGTSWGHQGEAQLIDRLRDACPDRLSLVAEVEGRVAGHILFTPVTIAGPAGEHAGRGLGPMSVLPELQGRGLGTQLVEHGLRELRQQRCPFVVVLGDPAFYARFGFLPAGPAGVESEFPGLPEGVFRILLLESQPAPTGVARYHPAFSAMDDADAG